MQSKRNEFNRGSALHAASQGVLCGAVLVLLSSACQSEKPAGSISPQTMADGLHAVMSADRTVYTRQVVNRLQNDEKVIKATEHWKDEKTLPLPAQMFRMGAEMVAEKSRASTMRSCRSGRSTSRTRPRPKSRRKV